MRSILFFLHLNRSTIDYYTFVERLPLLCFVTPIVRIYAENYVSARLVSFFRVLKSLFHGCHVSPDSIALALVDIKYVI